MLLGMTFGMARQSRQLTAIAGNIEQQANAEHGTVKASIHYFRTRQGSKEVDGLASLKRFQGEWKAELSHFARYPFAAGMKILPAALVEQAVAVNATFIAREAGIRAVWLADEYPGWLASAPTRMGSLYDPGDFPSADDCMNRFKCEVVIVPLAEADQWQRIAVISPDLASTMQNTQNAAVARATQQAHGKLWADVIEKLQNVVTVLSKDKTKLHESLLGNVISIVDLIPAYNQIHGDANLTALAEQVKAKLSEISVEDLRGSAEAKANALAKAKELVEEFEPYSRAFVDTDE
jgi:hypothetical protein